MMQCSTKLPSGFVYLQDIDPTIIENSRYATTDNFLNHRVQGYNSKKIICTKEAAEKLKLVHNDLKKQGYNLVVYDAYRPQCAVDHFVLWQHDNTHDQVVKQHYYPDLKKEELFQLGYVAEKSSHSKGSTFDSTLIHTGQSIKPIVSSKRTLKDGTTILFLDDNTVDMGSSFDLFHKASHHDTALITVEQTQRRNLLKDTMKKYGFNPYSQEWWHYTLADEPFPNTYFDFVIE